MPIEFTCNGCSARLRVADDNAGKSAKCPTCQTTSVIPNLAGQEPHTPQARNPYADSPYQSAAAKNHTPAGTPSQNPYSAPTYGNTPKRANFGDAGRPTRIEASHVISHAMEVWQNNLGLLVGATCVIFGVSIAFGVAEEGFTEFRPAGYRNVNFSVNVLSIVGRLVEAFLGIGITRICLALCRGQRAEFGMLFTGGDKFLPVVGMGILYAIIVGIGTLLLIIPGILIALTLWPYYYYIVDYQCPALDSFSRGIEVGKINMGASFLLCLAAFGIYLLGFLAICVGLIFAAPLVNMIFSVAYLMMKGELRAA